MIVDCRAVARAIDDSTQEGVRALEGRGVRPKIVEIIATGNQGVISYGHTKERKAATLGIKYEALTFQKNVVLEEVGRAIHALNTDPSVHGIIVGIPLFVHLDAELIINSIDFRKDVDGLGALNTFYLATDREDAGLLPATAKAAVYLLESLGSVSGKRILMLGRGTTVGRPAAQMLVNRDATVTIVHSRTIDISRLFRDSQIVVSATGRPGLIEPSWISEGQVIVDCGISFANGKTIGDVDTNVADQRGAVVTPVPGGVGSVTNAMLFSNLLKAIRLQGNS